MLRAAALAALSLLAALVAACGSGAAAGDADPAKLVPPNAMAYVEVTVRPDGTTRTFAVPRITLSDDETAALAALNSGANSD